MKLFTRAVLLTFLLSLSAVVVNAQVTAGFTVDHSAGCSPLVVHFTNTSSPISGTTYSWDFGNGDPYSPITSPSTTYTVPRTYTVTLTATNGSHMSTFTMTITVYPSPIVSFIASDTTICPGTTVTFTSTTVGGVPGAVTCTWNFGDGFSGSGTIVTHTYTSPGWYNVTLSATNADGCVASLTKPAYIHVFTPANVNFSATTYYCKAPAHVVFTNLTSGTGPFTYTWRFGDGSPTVTGTSPTHDYTSPGSYTVTLIVTDGDGCVDSLVMPGYITIANLSAAFTFPATACVNTNVTFTNTSSAHIGSTWYYGDGGSSSGDPGTHSYRTAGTYNVELVIYDGHCYDTIVHSIIIIPGPITSFAISPAHPCPNFAVTFAGTVPGGTTVTWLYGDGTGGSGTTTTHTFGRRGIFTTEMISVDPSTGCKDTVAQNDTMYDLVFSAFAAPQSGCKPLTVSFSTSAVTHEPDTLLTYPYPWPITSYSWTWGDGTPGGVGGTPTHTYTAVGTYYAVVTATTGNGCTVTDTVKISVGAPPVVTFTATPTHTCYHGNSITFTAHIVSGPANGFLWEFGDGHSGFDTTGTIVYSYGLPGIYSVTLTPSYNGCLGIPYVLTDYITIDSPKAIIEATVLCSPAKTVVFADGSIGDDTHLWMFGDGTTSTVGGLTHLYPALTTYTVTLATYNIRSGCRDTATALVDLLRPIPNFSAPDTAICRDSFVVLTATVTGGTASSYMWHSSGISADSFSSVYIDTFHTRGIYSIRLIIMDQNRCL